MPKTKPPPSAGYPETIKPILERAQAGDQTALPELKAILAQFPELAGQFGDLANHVESGLLDLIAGPSLLARESIRTHLDEMRTDLGIEDATPLEKILIDRVVLTWLQLHQADIEVLERLRGNNVASLSMAFTQRRQQQANARLMASIRTLATVRRLLRPALSPVQIATRMAGKDEVPAAVKTRMESAALEPVLAAN